ncbi:MAG: ferrous iron transport protein B [Ginsengibacter sp.]
MTELLHISLVGNPNSGKSSLFNGLTGLNQKVGNFPGVTVDKKSGRTKIGSSDMIVTDLPGTYSLYPKRNDEWVTYKVLMEQDSTITTDIVVLVADASNLKRNLLFCSQIIDLKLPVVIALTMMDIAKNKDIQIDVAGLERELGVPVIPVNPRKDKGIKELKKAIADTAENLYKRPARDFIDSYALAPDAITRIKKDLPEISDYAALHFLINHEHFDLTEAVHKNIKATEEHFNFKPTLSQANEILKRYSRIKQIMQQSVIEPDALQKALFNEKLDDLFLHKVWGYVILLSVLFLLFQSIFWIAQYPMDAIEWCFGRLAGFAGNIMPEGWFTELFINGILAGLSGIMVFVPQIMILFGLITLLEDTGYMARISFLTDKLMRKVGLNGKSVMPMISGLACAVPAIMSTRNIENKKERFLTIMCTPLMSCSARLPIYTILIALVIPKKLFFGFIGLQGLVMMGLYLLGTIMALVTAFILKWFIKSTERSFFILELPLYRGPRWKNLFYTMVEKAKVFVFQAGKVIMIISLLLWTLSSYGPKDKMHAVGEKYAKMTSGNADQQKEINRERKTDLLENSYAGMMGHKIEPLISPIGFDWKIGIALITSFAAREVFVGTMATLYSAGDDKNSDNATLRQKMNAAVKPDGSKVYGLATGMSLMIFYVLAMQCMSTLAVVKRETKSWKWPFFQIIYMTSMAYIFSFITYHIFL